MGFMKRLFGRIATSHKGATSEVPTSISYRRLRSLLREIIEYSPVIGDESQEGRIEQLVALGSSIVPEVEGAVQSVIQRRRSSDEFKRGRSSDELKNAALLCEAIGRMGGPGAFEILVGLATKESRSFEYRYVRSAAIRGLSHLRDRRAADILARLAQSDRHLAGDVDDALRVIGVEALRPPAIPSAPHWAGDARTWDRIAVAFVVSQNLTQQPTQQPDFRGLSQVAERFDDEDSHGVWDFVADQFLIIGNVRTALQCFVEALRHWPDDRSYAWFQIGMNLNKLPLEETRVAALESRLPPATTMRADRHENAKLLSELRQLLGPPGATPV